MTGLAVLVAAAGGVGFWVQNVVEANEERGVVGCDGASGLPRRSRHNRHAMMHNYANSLPSSTALVSLNLGILVHA